MKILSIVTLAIVMAITAQPCYSRSRGSAANQSSTASANQLSTTELSTGGISISKSTDIPASSAITGPLVTSINTCMGSSAVAGQGLSLGVSLGTTWTDKDCVRRLDAAFLAKLGDAAVARALMCQKEDVRAAYEAAGVSCFGIVQPSTQRTVDRIMGGIVQQLHNPAPVTLTRKHEQDVLGKASAQTKRFYRDDAEKPSEPVIFRY